MDNIANAYYIFHRARRLVKGGVKVERVAENGICLISKKLDKWLDDVRKKP